MWYKLGPGQQCHLIVLLHMLRYPAWATHMVTLSSLSCHAHGTSFARGSSASLRLLAIFMPPSVVEVSRLLSVVSIATHLLWAIRMAAAPPHSFAPFYATQRVAIHVVAVPPHSISCRPAQGYIHVAAAPPYSMLCFMPPSAGLYMWHQCHLIALLYFMPPSVVQLSQLLIVVFVAGADTTRGWPAAHCAATDTLFNPA